MSVGKRLSMWQGVSVLVTGGTGFVGSALVQRLREAGARVCVVGLQERIEDGYLQVDIASASQVLSAIKTVCPEVVFHFASYGVRAGQMDEARMHEVNVLGTQNVLRACEEIRPRSIVIAGSWTEYGRAEEGRAFQEKDTAHPLSSYGRSRLQATEFAMEWSRGQGIPLQVLRFSQLFGPGESDYRLIPTLLRSVGDGVPAQLGSRENVRDFLSLQDAVDASLWAAHLSEIAQIINIGSGLGTSTAQLVEIFRRLFPGMSEPVWGEYVARPWDVLVACLDVSLAKRLGWQAKISLVDGVRAMV